MPRDPRFNDLLVCLTFYTRLPLPAPPARDFGMASWASPLAGAIVGGLGALAYAAAHKLGLSPAIAALLAVAPTLALTGALHEDGLADTADGLGGGRTRAQKLEIMRDSRIGTFGACALVLSIALRAAAMASLADPSLVVPALIAAHAASRASLPAFMRLLPPARPAGLSARAGRPPLASAVLAGFLGVLGLLLGLRIAAALVALAVIVAVAGAIALLCVRQINGQTGDVLGALEQAVEVVVLLVAAARLAPG